MSYGGHDREPYGNGNFPALNQLSDLEFWPGPSSVVCDLDEMQAMIGPVKEVLLNSPPPQGISAQDYQRSTRAALKFLNRVSTNLKMLASPAPPDDMEFSFAVIVRMTGRYTFNKILEIYAFDETTHQEIMEDILHAAVVICSAYDLAFGHDQSRRRIGQLFVGSFTVSNSLN